MERRFQKASTKVAGGFIRSSGLFLPHSPIKRNLNFNLLSTRTLFAERYLMFKITPKQDQGEGGKMA
jgi:hypothetical protein